MRMTQIQRQKKGVSSTNRSHSRPHPMPQPPSPKCALARIYQGQIAAKKTALSSWNSIKIATATNKTRFVQGRAFRMCFSDSGHTARTAKARQKPCTSRRMHCESSTCSKPVSYSYACRRLAAGRQLVRHSNSHRSLIRMVLLLFGPRTTNKEKQNASTSHN